MFKNIVVPIDLQDRKGTERTLTAVDKYFGNDVQICLISVLPGYQMSVVASYFPKDAVTDALGAMEGELSALGRRCLKDKTVTVKASEGNTYKGIVKHAESISADLIVINAQKHGRVEKMVLGSVTAKVTESASCSVLVLKG
ncbi:universal stress protein [uncultured Neptuniibacter sp.]|jgi:nucleotide-binding universal stress UspA family protein|uniref:universal stress protein n=1 Tax=uncultured Neptuniibacter sp. TaxID=502143 RepID=UPI0026301F16|nr:universal stress protein [uncultured Neptuniibacter sp.]